MTSQPGKQVERQSDNEIWSVNVTRMKYFWKLMKQECNKRNIFLEKSNKKCGGETSPRPFSEKLKLSISLDQ